MLKITMIIVIAFFSIILTPHERAAANPLAVGGALYLGGAGVYVLGAVAVGGLAGLAGCVSCQEDIEAHANRTWDGTTQLAKDGLQLMVDSSIGAWGATSSALTATDTKFNTWMDSQINGFAETYINSKYYGSIGMSTAGIYSGSAPHNGGWVFTGGQSDSIKRFIVNGVHVSGFEFRNDPYNLKMTMFNGTAFVYANVVLPAGMTKDQFRVQMQATSNNLNAMAAVMATAGINLMVGNNDIYQSYQAAVSSFNEPWTEMRDAGLVLPTDNARLVDQYGPVTYDPATDSYAGIDGVNVAREDIVGAEYQKPHWKTLQDLTALGGAAAGLGAGLYIDGWAGAGAGASTSVYDPVTDTTTTTSSSTGSTTNVTTGETVTTDAVTTTTVTTGDTTASPPKTPEGETPKTQTGKSNRWGKLVTTKFPFSLPWDLFFVLSFLNAEPKTPVFSIDERINKRENVEGIQIKFDIDLSFLDPYVPWFRRFIVLGFALFLILNTRKLLGGAQ